jgi:hypothetical protein
MSRTHRSKASSAAASAAAAPQASPLVSPPRASGRKRGAAGALAESALAGVDAADELQQQQADRAFWESFSTPLLWAWLSDFDNAPLAPGDSEQREKIISALVQHGAERPRLEGNADSQVERSLPHLVRVWCKANKAPKSAAPGRHLAPRAVVNACAVCCMRACTAVRTGSATSVTGQG